MRGAVVLGLWLGGVVAVVSGCPTAPCGPATCSGCCSVEGECVAGVAVWACGAAGAECAVCGQGFRCRQGTCHAPDAGPDAGPPCGCAAGCCLSDGGCEPGNALDACGLTDRVCRACAVGERCDRGWCTSAACSGCVDPAGQCQPGTASTACGSDGGVCVGCLTGERCEGRVCVMRPCNPTTCATGCCDSTSQCITPVTDTQCGALASDCVACSLGRVCTQGVCQ